MEDHETDDATGREYERAGGRDDCRVEVIPGGPVLVRGVAGVLDDEGRGHRARRPVVAVCACGLTQRGPWCDGTHKVIPADRR